MPSPSRSKVAGLITEERRKMPRANIVRGDAGWEENWSWKDNKGVWRKRKVWGKGKAGFGAQDFDDRRDADDGPDGIPDARWRRRQRQQRSYRRRVRRHIRRRDG